jgi:hypothetical protein
VTQLEPNCPPEVLDLLAWYPDEGLSGEERGVVEAHAATCPECRREILDGLRGTHPSDGAPPAERVLARVFERIAAGDTARDTVPGSAATPLRVAPRRAPPVRVPPPARRRAVPAWAAAAAVALVVGSLATLAAVRLTRAPAPVYETASAPPLPALPAPAGSAEARLDVVLRDDVSAAQVQAALRGLGAEIVGGPTALGRYEIRLPSGADAGNAASALRAEGTGIATFAEPLDAR